MQLKEFDYDAEFKIKKKLLEYVDKYFCKYLAIYKSIRLSIGINAHFKLLKQYKPAKNFIYSHLLSSFHHSHQISMHNFVVILFPSFD